MPSCVWVRVPSLALFFGDRGLIPGLFFYARETSFGQSLRASRPRTPLSLRDISRGRTETSAAVSVARTFFRDRGVFPGLFFYVRETSSGQSLRTSRPRTPLSLRDISRGRTETSVAVSVSRTFFRDRGVFPGLFFCACVRSSGKRSGPRGFVPLCHCVTSPEGERKRLSPFRSLARFLEIEECSQVSFKPSCGVISGKLSERTPHSTEKLCVLLTLSGLKRFSLTKLLIVAVMSVNNRFNPDKITHINFSLEHP